MDVFGCYGKISFHGDLGFLLQLKRPSIFATDHGKCSSWTLAAAGGKFGPWRCMVSFRQLKWPSMSAALSNQYPVHGDRWFLLLPANSSVEEWRNSGSAASGDRWAPPDERVTGASGNLEDSDLAFWIVLEKSGNG